MVPWALVWVGGYVDGDTIHKRGAGLEEEIRMYQVCGTCRPPKWRNHKAVVYMGPEPRRTNVNDIEAMDVVSGERAQLVTR